MDRPSGMLRPWFLAILAVIALLGMVAVRLRRQGLSARSEPSALEQFAAGKVRRWAIPVAARRLPNPLPATHETLQQGKEHWADHCATCHANDGSGDTEMGRNLYPRAPDMRKPATQSLSDGELYYIIRNGVPLTGMPAWGDPSLGHGLVHPPLARAFAGGSSRHGKTQSQNCRRAGGRAGRRRLPHRRLTGSHAASTLGERG